MNYWALIRGAKPLLVLSILCYSGNPNASAVEPGKLPALAPGVLIEVPPAPEEQETTSVPQELTSITSRAVPWKPHFAAETETLHALGQDVILRRPVWQIKFSYKPLRIVTVNVRGADGVLRERAVWYLVYRIENTGHHLAPVPEKDEFNHDRHVIRQANMELRFFPTFRLYDHERKVELLDRVIPEAMARIHDIEINDPNVPLYDSVKISTVPLEVGSQATDKGVWGVALWEGVDRRADFLSVSIQGLSNAYRGEEPKDGGEKQIMYKTLQLIFWRPGDPVDEHVGEFRNGFPPFAGEAQSRALKIYGLSEPQDFLWKYRQ